MMFQPGGLVYKSGAGRYAQRGTKAEDDKIEKAFQAALKLDPKAKKGTNKYLNNTENFTNMAYASKGGNGNEASGDGYKFRGRGFFQLTLRDNYTGFFTFYNGKFSTSYGADKDAGLVASDQTLSIISSFWYFNKYTVPKIRNSSTFLQITKTVNAKAVGLEERQIIYNKALLELH